MSTETCITLPDTETIMSRLKAVSSDDHCVQKLYPPIAKNGGQERVPMGIIMMLQLAIHDYTEGMSPMMVAVLNMNMNSYIDALVPDQAAAAEVKSHWAKIAG